VSGAAHAKSAGTRVGQLLVLGLVLGLFAVLRMSRVAGENSGELVAATGLLLMSGMLFAELLEVVRLPHLTGYIAAGVLAGPHVLHFIGHDAVKQLELVNTLALALIALAGGLELKLSDVRVVARGVGFTMLSQSIAVLVVQSALFMVLARYVPFTRDLPLPVLFGISVLWGILAVSRSPSATLAILSQTRARGPLTRFSLAFVMTSDVLVLVMMAAGLSLMRPLIEPGASISLEKLRSVAHELLGSVSIGTTLGLLLIAYLRLVGRQVLLLLVAIGFALTAGVQYLRFEPMLTFLTAGFVVQNMSSQGEKLLHNIEETGGVVFVVFFATAGAHLDIPLLQSIWPIALALCASRGVVTWIAHRAGAALAGDSELIRRWGWSALISQAGLTLGLSAVLARTFPSVGEGLRSLVIATVAINEVVGPVFFKLALERAGEVRGEG
jgi:Kef-type K+ transport system membrane component KefB